MSKVQSALTAEAYACFALQQPLTLDQLADATDGHGFPLASAQTPEWFAAAGSAGSSLEGTAPELAVHVSGSDASQDRLDLVRMYAPELETPAVPTDGEAPESGSRSAETEETRTEDRQRLLKELGHLDT